MKILNKYSGHIDDQLVYAVSKNDLKYIKSLIENGADVNVYLGAPLRNAALFGYLEIVKYLVEKGADIHANNGNALCAAAYSGYLEIVKYLVENGADIHTDNGRALKSAVTENRFSVIKYLIEKGAYPQEEMHIIERLQDQVLKNNPSSVIFITNLRKDLKEKYSDLLDLHDIGL